ncbi:MULTISPECIES: nitroreductase family protein [unclassified Nocardioides]|uniref:nitroreductase family protein n=1 Tax=unclassified Nocardioides TaxID=2615069 RepID=UPI000056F62F|nr:MULTISPECIES: nitroreductase family protein [unclassified Nocardioides]ABL80554.1 nitroreductase [Nocardioides sp. JS614]
MAERDSGDYTNPVVETILGRRTIRFEYDRSREVPRTVLEVVTACGLAAPSSKNAKPWRFHVVQYPKLLDEIAEAAEAAPDVEAYVPHDPRTGLPHPHWPSSVVESAAMLREVPAAIFIENRGVFSGGRKTLRTAHPDAVRESLTSYAFECIGIGTAIENMWIAAISLGLSAFFSGDVLIAEAEISSRLHVEGDIVGVLGLGYSTAAPLPARMSPAATQVDEPVVWH